MEHAPWLYVLRQNHNVTKSWTEDLPVLNTGTNLHSFITLLLRALKSLKIFKQIYLSEITYPIFKFKKTKATYFDAYIEESFKLLTKATPQ